MKKSKIINLVLLTVSFTAAVKLSAAGNNETGSMVSIEHVDYDNDVYLPGGFNTGGKINAAHNPFQEPTVQRGGFGDDDHSGAEQHHDEKK